MSPGTLKIPLSEVVCRWRRNSCKQQRNSCRRQRNGDWILRLVQTIKHVPWYSCTQQSWVWCLLVWTFSQHAANMLQICYKYVLRQSCIATERTKNCRFSGQIPRHSLPQGGRQYGVPTNIGRTYIQCVYQRFPKFLHFRLGRFSVMLRIYIFLHIFFNHPFAPMVESSDYLQQIVAPHSKVWIWNFPPWWISLLSKN